MLDNLKQRSKTLSHLSKCRKAVAHNKEMFNLAGNFRSQSGGWVTLLEAKGAPLLYWYLQKGFRDRESWYFLVVLVTGI